MATVNLTRKNGKDGFDEEAAEQGGLADTGSQEHRADLHLRPRYFCYRCCFILHRASNKR